MNLEVAVMAGGWGHTLSLTRCGQVFSFGAGYKDERTGEITPIIGISAAATATEREEMAPQPPAKIFEGDLGSEPVKAIASGWDHCMVVTNDGSLLTWGAGSGGQLGHGDAGERLENSFTRASAIFGVGSYVVPMMRMQSKWQIRGEKVDS